MRGRRVVVGVVVASVGVLGLLPASASAADADTTPPVLRSASFSTASVRAEQPLTLVLGGTDDVAVTRSVVTLVEPTSGAVKVLDERATPLALPITPGRSWANGTWQIDTVVLHDAVGNYAYYRRDGGFHTLPTSPPRGHGVDLRTPTFTLTGASDLSPPVLRALGLTTVATVAGETSVASFSVSDAVTSVASISLTWQNRTTGRYLDAGAVAAPPTQGRLSVTLPQAGQWVLLHVRVTDAHGNWAEYDRDGDVGKDGRWGEHDLALADVVVPLRPARPQVRAVSHSRGITVVRSGREDDEVVLTGFRVTVRPAGITRDVPFFDSTLELDGLPMGIEQVVTVVARSAWGDSSPTTLTGRPVLSRNVTGALDAVDARIPDVLAQLPHGAPEGPQLFVYPGAPGGRLLPAQQHLFPQSGQCDAISTIRMAGNRSSKVLCQNDDLMVHSVGYVGPALGTRGWRVMRFVDGGFDLNGDRTADVIAVDPAGQLRLYAQTSKGTLVLWPRIGTGWGSMISVISAGDLTGDGRNDIAAVDAAGRLWLYPGNGKGGVTGRTQIGSGWHHMAALLPMSDLDRDGKDDLGGITPAGDLRLYRGTGTGGVRNGVVIGRGWDRYL